MSFIGNLNDVIKIKKDLDKEITFIKDEVGLKDDNKDTSLLKRLEKIEEL